MVLVFVLQIQYPSVKYKWTQLNTIEEFHYVGHVLLDKWQETYVQSIGKKNIKCKTAFNISVCFVRLFVAVSV